MLMVVSEIVPEIRNLAYEGLGPPRESHYDGNYLLARPQHPKLQQAPVDSSHPKLQETFVDTTLNSVKILVAPEEKSYPVSKELCIR